MPDSHAVVPAAVRLRAHPLVPALALATGAFLCQLDVTAVVVAMPAIGTELGFGLAGFAWVMDAYSLAFTGFLVAAGALADRHGRRRALIAGNLVFALASLFCGLAWNGPLIWAARALQGAAAAFVITGAIALVADGYREPAERARAFGAMGVVSGIAMAVGPSLGGLVAASFGWRWIFLANVPLCLVLAWGLPRLVAESRAADPAPFDVTGIVLMTGALGLAIVALLQAGVATTAGALFWPALLLAASLGLAKGFAAQQARRPRPILDVRLFGQRSMAGIAILLVALSVSYWAVLVYLPLFLERGFGLPAAQVGIALLAATLPMLVLPPFGARLAARFGWRGLFGAAFVLMVSGNVALAVAAGLGLGGLALAGMAASGLGAALAHPQLSGAVVALARPAETGMAAAVTVVLRQAGFALGIAMLGATLAAGFVWLFAAAALIAAIGAGAALVLLPAPQRR